MEALELSAGISLVVLVVGVAAFFAWRQLRALRALLWEGANLSDDDRRFVRQQIVRRLLGSVLLAAFAGMLVGWFFLEPEFSGLQPAGDPDAPVMAEHQKDSLRFFTAYVIVALLLLLGLLGVAAADLWATARFGLRQHKQIEQARQDLFREEAARVRRRRSELN